MKPEMQYTDLRREEHDVHDDSATEVSVSLMGHDEKPWKGDVDEDRRERRSTLLRLAGTYRWLLDTTLLLVILGLLLERRWQNPAIQSAQFELNGDLTGFAPKFSQQITTFKPDPMYAPENSSEFFTHAVKQKWLDLVPRGLGYLEVKEPSHYDNLPSPLTEYKNRTVFTTSMTHQLHCLYAIIDVYSVMTEEGEHKVPKETPWHLSHCFDYLRQSIMCCGDVALEGAQTTFPKGFDGSDGWDAKHVCKDYSQVYDHLERNRADNQSWI